MHEYDNRYFWMNLKRIVGSHFANYREAWEANRLIQRGKIHPTLSKSYPLAETGQAAFEVHRNMHQGKVGVLCLAPEPGMGVRNPELRATAPGRHQPLPGQVARRRTPNRPARTPWPKPASHPQGIGDTMPR